MALETQTMPQLELEAVIGFNGKFSSNVNSSNLSNSVSFTSFVHNSLISSR